MYCTFSIEVLLSALKLSLALLTSRLFFHVGFLVNSSECVHVCMCMCVDMFLRMCSMIETKVTLGEDYSMILYGTQGDKTEIMLHREKGSKMTRISST